MKRYEKIARNTVIGSSILIGSAAIITIATFAIIVAKVGL